MSSMNYLKIHRPDRDQQAEINFCPLKIPFLSFFQAFADENLFVGTASPVEKGW